MQPTDSLNVWSLALVFLFAKMIFNSTLQGYSASKAKRFYFAEDSKFFGIGAPVNREPTEFMRRADALWENDLENVPVFLLLLLGYALIVGDARYTLIFALVFCIARVAHATTILAGVQPWRTLIFVVGQIAAASAAMGIVRHVLFTHGA